MDLGGVRIHVGAGADAAARVIGAAAFTLGSDITFAARRYAPDTTQGRELLGHEVAHVAQVAAGAENGVRCYEAPEHQALGGLHGRHGRPRWGST